jgi:hypothetical protein
MARPLWQAQAPILSKYRQSRQRGARAARSEHLDANSRQRGRSRSLGQVSDRWQSLGAVRGRWRCCTFALYGFWPSRCSHRSSVGFSGIAYAKSPRIARVCGAPSPIAPVSRWLLLLLSPLLSAVWSTRHKRVRPGSTPQPSAYSVAWTSR